MPHFPNPVKLDASESSCFWILCTSSLGHTKQIISVSRHFVHGFKYLSLSYDLNNEVKSECIFTLLADVWYCSVITDPWRYIISECLLMHHVANWGDWLIKKEVSKTMLFCWYRPDKLPCSLLGFSVSESQMEITGIRDRNLFTANIC